MSIYFNGLNSIKWYLILSTLIFTFQLTNLNAQQLFSKNDLSQIQVETLSDAEIVKIKNEFNKSNISIEQAETLALSKGMSASEFLKLKLRLQNLPSNATSTNTGNRTQDNSDISNPKYTAGLTNSLIFGSELYDKPSLSFEPNLKIATPMNYILGPGDELQISIYGVQEYNATIPVSVEGRITLQNVGQINVGGTSFEAAKESIKKAMSNAYSSLKTGQSKISVSLSKVTTIKVTIIGSQQPGNYSVSSLATVFNALYLAGGPSDNGSYRTIQLIRNNKLERTIDIYHFLISGDQSDNVGLKNNDVILIPTYSNRVTIKGEVKRPGIFELLPDETFTNLLVYASGFTEDAFKSSVNVIQKTESELKVKDISELDYSKYQPQLGDEFTVSKILNRFGNRVKINGAVFRPGIYELTPHLTISALISKADGLKEDVYNKSARLIRLRPDLTNEVVYIDLPQVIAGNKEYDLELKREDELMIYSIFDLKNEYNVIINGEVRKPGTYTYIENLSLGNLILQAGGTTDASSKKVEIARMLKSDSLNKSDKTKIELINIEINSDNIDNIDKFLLKPFDVISIRRMPTYYIPEIVKISGAIQFPGKYAMSNKKEKVLDIMNRSGGITNDADKFGVKIIRTVNVNNAVNEFNQPLDNSATITIPLNYKQLSRNKNSKSNIILFPGDEIFVAKKDESVKVLGNVLLSSQIPYKHRGVRYYLASVGGINEKGWKRKVYVVYPNGMAATTNNFLFCKFYPKVKAGSQIVVPAKPERRKISTIEVVSTTSVLTSLASLIFLLFK